MAGKSKVVLTDYVWESLAVEEETLATSLRFVALRTKSPEEFLPEAADCEALPQHLRRPHHRRGHEPDASVQDHRAVRHRRGHDRRRRGDPGGHHRHEQPDLLHRGGGRAHDGPLLACARKVPLYDRLVRRSPGGAARQAHVPAGRADARPGRLREHRLGGGGPGRRVRDARPLLRPFVQQGQPVSGEKRPALPEMLGEADFVSLHPLLVPSTRGMIGDEAFRYMKSTAFLVNCARGPIVDTQGASRPGPGLGPDRGMCARHDGLPSLCPTRTLRGRENVILTPHAAWYSEQAW